MPPVYQFLNESFDEPNGSLAGYLTSLTVPANNTNQFHYNLRSFHSDHITTPRTMDDMSFWNVGHFQGITMGTLTTQTIGGVTSSQLQTYLDSQNQGQLDAQNQGQLDFIFVDNEQWTLSTASSGTTMSLGKASQYRFTDMLTVTLSGTNVTVGSGIVSSIFLDDIFTPFQNPGPYYIEFILRGFNDITSPITLDRAKSFVDFSSDATGTYNPLTTDSFSFSSSLANISGTQNGDCFFRVDRASLTNTNISALTNIRFRLVASGTGAPLRVRIQSMRMYDSSNYTFPSTDIDTKRDYFAGALGESGAITLAPDSGNLIFNPSRPKELTQYVKFNSGTLPVVASGTNIFDLHFRTALTSTNQISRDRIRLGLDNNQTVVNIYETISGSESVRYTTGSGTNPLSPNTDYVFKTELYENQIRGSIYNYQGVFIPSSPILTTGWVTLLDQPRRGYVAYRYMPYNYDFTLAFLRLSDTRFGNIITKESPSYTPVVGVQLGEISSVPINIIDTQTFDPSGDGSVSTGTFEGQADTIITRTGATWYGGYISDQFLDLGTPEYTYITGQVFPHNGFAGTLRLALIDPYGLIGFLVNLSNIVIGQWNTFNVPIRATNILPEKYKLLVHDITFNPDVFELADIELNHYTVGWYATANGQLSSITWQPFYEALNNQYAALNFGTPGTNLAAKGIALSDQNPSWIQSFNMIPIYGSSVNIYSP